MNVKAYCDYNARQEGLPARLGFRPDPADTIEFDTLEFCGYRVTEGEAAKVEIRRFQRSDRRQAERGNS